MVGLADTDLFAADLLMESWNSDTAWNAEKEKKSERVCG